MHLPHAQPRASIYYRYEVFPAAPRPAVETAVPVVVVGAGPIGLYAALDLARHGVPVLLLAAERQVSEGSRAIVYTRRSMEILHTVGVAEAVERLGLGWRHGSSFVRGRCVFRMEAPHDDDERFMPMTNLQQQVLEAGVLRRQRNGLVVAADVEDSLGAHGTLSKWMEGGARRAGGEDSSGRRAGTANAAIR